MSKLKLPIIIAVVLAAAGAGLFFSGIVGGDKGAAKKYVVEPIPLAEPGFIVNLADADKTALLSINLALELEPMDEAHHSAFMGDGGHKGSEAPGPLKVATYPKFADAVITETSQMTSNVLNTPAGKAELKKRLLNRFNEIAERDAADLKRSVTGDDPEHVGPPYHVYDIQFTRYAIQTGG